MNRWCPRGTTWSSPGGVQDGAPYVGVVPIGRVTKVVPARAGTSVKAVVAPFVDFSSLDLVGVVVPSGSTSDRSVIEADGVLR